MQTRPPQPGELGPIFTGRRVLDVHGLPLGTVTEVVYGSDDYLPDFLVVDPGPLRRSHCVPTDGACQTVHGDIVVAWDRDWFRLSPTAPRRPTLTRSTRRLIELHYARP